MTIETTTGGARRSRRTRRMTAGRSQQRDLERYAGLFASRTRVMKLLGHARPDGDHSAARGDLARRRPAGHVHVPARHLRRDHGAHRRGVRARRRSSTGPPRGSPRRSACIERGDGARGHEGRPRRRARDDRRPAGDRPRDQGADRPGRRRRGRGARPTRAPCRSSRRYQARRRADRDGRRTACASTCSRRRSTGSIGDGRRPKFIYTVPNFQNPAGVTLSLERRRRLVEVGARARAARARGQPVRRCCATRACRCRRCYSLDGGVYVMYLGTFSKILSPGIRLGWVVAPPPVLEKTQPRQAGRRPLHLHAVAADRAGVLRGGELARLRRVAHRDLPRAPRHDARRAGRVLPAARPSGRTPAAASSSGRRCPTSSTPPTCSRVRCATTWPSCRARPPTSTGAGATPCG